MDEQSVSGTGVIINPKSGRGNGKGVALAAALAGVSGIDVVVLEKFEQLEHGLKVFAEKRVDKIFISSGDGTIQAIQTFIAESGAFAALPHLCLLPHGTTNMTAADLGFRRKSIAAQAAFIAHPVARETKARHTLRAANPGDGHVRHGMFLGTGAVSEATRYCQVVFNDKGVKGQFATFATVATLLAKTVFLKPNPDDPLRFDKPYQIALRKDGAVISSGQQLMCLATTLDKLILNTRPFWGGATDSLRVSTFPYPVPNVFRWFIPSVYGGEMRTAPPGAASFCTDKVEIESAVDFVIDGEFFAPPKGQALQVETGPLFTYIVN